MNILFFLQVAFLTAKRAEDKSKMKEMEKFKVQISQFTDYKAQWSSAQVFFIFWFSDVLPGNTIVLKFLLLNWFNPKFNPALSPRFYPKLYPN